MLSTRKVPADKSPQGEKQVESKTVPPTVMKNSEPITTKPSESIKTVGSYKTNLEKDNVPKTETKEKTQPKTDNLIHVKLERTQPRFVEPINVEMETEILKIVDKEEKSSSKTVASEVKMTQCQMIPIADKTKAQKPSNVAVPRKCPPLSAPLLNQRPLVLTTHLVPSLPINLFEVLVEAIEVATEKPVVLLYEPRSNRPVAKEIADIAILPASEDWEDGVLLPASFNFEHHLNKTNSPCVYADVIVATDRAPHVAEMTDLRGHRCSLPDRKKKIGAAALLFNCLRSKGESPAFFGNTLDADSQVATLRMVAGNQAEVGVLESPVIKCHKNVLPGINSLHILTSLGPLPPYRIMTKKTLPDDQVKKIAAYLLNINQNKEWIDKFAPFGVKGFTQNVAEYYELNDVKSAVTSVPYY